MNELKERLFDSLTEYWQKIVDDLVQSLYDVGRVASGATVQSIGAAEEGARLVDITTSGFRVRIGMPSYYQFIDEGVSGAKRNTGISRFKYKKPLSSKTRPPISAMLKFIDNRTITPRPSNTRSGKKKDAQEMRLALAFAISHKIWRDGLEPTNFYSKVINDPQLQEFERRLLEQFSDFILDIVRIE